MVKQSLCISETEKIESKCRQCTNWNEIKHSESMTKSVREQIERKWSLNIDKHLSKESPAKQPEEKIRVVKARYGYRYCQQLLEDFPSFIL